MTPFRIGKEKYNVPDSWNDLSVADVEFIKANPTDELAILERLTKIPVEKLEKIDTKIILPFFEFLSVPIMDFVEPTNELVLNGELFTLPNDIGTERWSQKILAFRYVKKHDMVRVVATYAQKKFNDKEIDVIFNQLQPLPAITVYACAKFLFLQIQRITEMEKQLDTKPTPQQIQAGIANFNVLGDMNVVDQVAHGKVWKYEKVLAIDYNTIFNKLLKTKISINFENEYAKIIRQE